MSRTPFPPPTVCAKAQRPPPAEGKAVTASHRNGRGTVDGGPKRQQVRKRRPPQPAQLGYSTRTPDGVGNRTGPHRAQPRGLYTAGRAQRPDKLPPAVPPAAHGHKAPPHPSRGRSEACAAAAALWDPRGCPSTLPGTHQPFRVARDRSRRELHHPASCAGVRGLPDPLCRRRQMRNALTHLRASLRDTLIGF